jgi:DNA-3-methyladenine glycosylase II
MTAPSVGPAPWLRVPLPVKQPFTFEHSLAFLRRFPAMTGEQALTDAGLAYAVRQGGATVGVRVAPSDDHLCCALTSTATLDETLAAAVVDRVAFFLGADDDLSPFYDRAQGDAPFQAVVSRLHGYHQVKFPSPLELLVWAILCQRAPMPVARGMKRSLVGHFNNAIDVDGQTHLAFPDIDQLLELTDTGWGALITNRRKSAYLAGAVRQFAELDEHFLRCGDEALVREQLLALPGIGPWSASFLMIRGLGRTGSVTPDTEARRAVARVYGHQVTDEELDRLAAPYGPWKGYWLHYLRVSG